MLEYKIMYAVIQTGGKQYKVEKGNTLDVELLGSEAGSEIIFDKVLLTADNDNVQIGQPYLQNVSVKAKLLENVTDKKVVIYKFKNKTGYRRKRGHRQKYSRILIEAIGG